MELALLFLHIVIVVFLIAVVLLQRSEGGALGMGGGGGGGGGVMSGRGAATALQKVTWGLGTAFIVSSVILALYGRQAVEDSSVAEVPAAVEGTASSDGASPLLSDDLTPVLPGSDQDAGAPAPADAPAASDDVTPQLPSGAPQ